MRPCFYCGRRPCECPDRLVRVERTMRGDGPTHKHKGFAATCGRCGTVNRPGRFNCIDCGCGLYRQRKSNAAPAWREDTSPTKGTEA